jgi:hypothetical protein
VGILLLFEDLKCVSCGSGRVRRCRRRGLVEHTFLRFLRLHPFHCIDCYKRFYNRSEPGNVQPGNLPVMAESPKVLQDQPSLKTRPLHQQPSLEKKPLQDQSGLKTKPLQDQPSLKTKVPVNGRQVERRGFSRLSCRIPARVVVGAGSSTTGVVSGISLNGCFIETPKTFPAGSEIELTLALGQETHTRALVRRSVPATGMGIEFTLTNVPNFRRLQTIARNSVRLHGKLLATLLP